MMTLQCSIEERIVIRILNMIRKKNILNRRKGALERLLKVKKPDDRQKKEIEILQKRVNIA